jgi:hypothetical protein
MSEDDANTTPTLAAPESGVTVRMYRTGGIGDCFLLAFRATDGTARYMLIDCGVHKATSGGADRLRTIVRDIAQATGNRLHVVVATHEHWDHLSGFQFAESLFDEIQIDQVWVAWTEDRSDELANRLREKHAFALRALTAALARLKAVDDAWATPIEQVLDFQGEIDPVLGISTTAGQMDYVHRRVAAPHYCQPGEPPLCVPGVKGVRIFVLGPPRDEALLSRSDPSTTDSEVYERPLALEEPMAFYLAAVAGEDPHGLTDDQNERWQRSRPFDRTHRLPLGDPDRLGPYRAFFQEWYGFGPDQEGVGPSWRRIDTDWLAAAGSLALDLDNDTNNTCLVLAIELVDSGKVLLFAADAQVGNWLSWHDVEWFLEHEEGVEMVTGGDLVWRTVLYKVGHHASHNATLREKGLEMMEQPDLVALIPVYEEQAAKMGKKGWAMPFPPLLVRLEEKTRGRVVRADTGLPQDAGELPADAWQAFCAQAVEDPGGLWIDYTVTGEGPSQPGAGGC